MNDDPLAHGPEADDRPHGGVEDAPTTALAPYRAPPRRRARLLRWWLGLSLALAVALAVCVMVGVNQFDLAPMHIVIDNNDLGDGITINGLSEGGRALLAVGVLLVALLLLLVVPLALMLVMACVAVAVVCALAVPLIAVALALAAVTSPLWGVALVVWLLARRRPSPPPARSATMTA